MSLQILNHQKTDREIHTENLLSVNDEFKGKSFVAIALFAFITGCSVSAPDKERNHAGVSWEIHNTSIPFQQQQFCRIAENFREELSLAQKHRNEIKENAAFRTRYERLVALLPDGAFSNWIVRAVSVRQANDGSATVLFELPCNVVISSYASCNTILKPFVQIVPNIPEGSPRYAELKTVVKGDFLGVSGTFNLADFRIPSSEPHCFEKDIVKSHMHFFISTIERLSNLK